MSSCKVVHEHSATIYKIFDTELLLLLLLQNYKLSLQILAVELLNSPLILLKFHAVNELNLENLEDILKADEANVVSDNSMNIRNC